MAKRARAKASASAQGTKSRSTASNRASNFSSNDIRDMLRIVKELLPTGGDAWEKVARDYNIGRARSQVREASSLRRKFNKLRNTKPRTGDPHIPWEVEEAILVHELIEQRAGAIVLETVFDKGDLNEDDERSGDEADSEDVDSTRGDDNDGDNNAGGDNDNDNNGNDNDGDDNDNDGDDNDGVDADRARGGIGPMDRARGGIGPMDQARSTAVDIDDGNQSQAEDHTQQRRPGQAHRDAPNRNITSIDSGSDLDPSDLPRRGVPDDRERAAPAMPRALLDDFDQTTPRPPGSRPESTRANGSKTANQPATPTSQSRSSSKSPPNDPPRRLPAATGRIGDVPLDVISDTATRKKRLETILGEGGQRREDMAGAMMMMLMVMMEKEDRRAEDREREREVERRRLENDRLALEIKLMEMRAAESNRHRD